MVKISLARAVYCQRERHLLLDQVYADRKKEKEKKRQYLSQSSNVSCCYQEFFIPLIHNLCALASCNDNPPPPPLSLSLSLCVCECDGKRILFGYWIPVKVAALLTVYIVDSIHFAYWGVCYVGRIMLWP